MRKRDDQGAVAVLALAFLVAGSLIAVALTSDSTANIQNISNLQTLRTVNFAADAAMDGAIQQVRYHGSCENFPKSGSLQLTSSEYVFVTCTNTPLPIITALETSGSTTLTSPSSSFLSAYAVAAQPVANTSGTLLGKIVSVSSDGTTATMSSPATSSGTVEVGEAGERYDTFQSCASASSLSGCTSAQLPEVTAIVLYGDVQSGSTPKAALGYTATVESWTVTDAGA